MGFIKKTWKNRIAEYINRRRLTMEDGSASLVTVARDEGTISQEGDAFNAANMNDLEDRIAAGFEEINQSLTDYKDMTASKAQFINSGATFIFSKIGNKAVIHAYGSVNAPVNANYILCSGFPSPICGFAVLNIINLSTGVSGSCLVNRNGQLTAVEPILTAPSHEFSISGTYICL